MPISYETGGDLSNGGKFVDQEGWYHFLVTMGTDVPTKKFGADKGGIIAGMIAQFDVAVLASTVPNQQDKTMDLCVRGPSAAHKDGGDFCRKVADRWWLALNLATRQQLEAKGTPISIDPKKANGAQFIAKISKGDKYLDLDGANVFHIDDSAVKDQPKNADALKLIPAAHRWIGSQAEAPKPTTQPTAQSAGVDYAGL